MIEEFYSEFERTAENNTQIKILLIDEYAAYITWLVQNNKNVCQRITRLISTQMMRGRSRRTYTWCVQQRMTASLFPSGIGAIDNFQICVGLGRLSVDSRKSLFAGEHFENEAFEKAFHPTTGQGIILIDGQELQPLQVPYISDKEKLRKLLVELGKEGRRNGEAV